MSIRAEDKPKAFEAEFFHTNGSLAQYGAFDFKPGAIVRRDTRTHIEDTQIFVVDINVFIII